MTSSIFRFGLPLGSAMLLVAFLDTASNFLSCIMDLGAMILYSYLERIKFDLFSIIWILLVCLWIFTNLGLLWFGVISKGNLTFLTAWIVTTLLCNLIVLGVWFYALWHLWGYWKHFFTELYSLLIFNLTTAYMLYIGFQVARALKNNESILEPIGRGFKHIFNFYRDDPTLAAKVLLVSELVIMGEYIFSRQLLIVALDRPAVGHEGDMSGGIIVEEYIIKSFRFIVTSVGLFLITKGHLLYLKYFGLAYAILLGSSVIDFLYLLITWNAEHIFFTLSYYFLVLCSIGYRSFILYCLSRVVQPYISSSSFLHLGEST